MTAAQRATLQIVLASALEDDPADLPVSYGYERSGDVADALRAALGTCGTCAHADTADTTDGWCFCAAPSALNRFHDAAFPFRYRSMPLGERCTGWTAKPIE